ncbi:nicotinate-nucleotide--dimethylbenzimidazole phosphoribosyltransferase [Consotaella aegiceratis]|uniref:nicotinate-nucleotide--dimethylbenzimidazole phosphoribosyltransferase n=1 Tax=Consotaella aegiceratis TaxID=3097961 RepID=UPI002F3EB54D
MSVTGLPFDDIRALVRDLPGPDRQAVHDKRHREAELAKPFGSLGRLEDLSEWLAAWTGRQPAVNRPLVVVFAGSHGVAANGISADAPETAAERAANLATGGAAVNQICATFDLGLKVFDLALEVPTADITREAALDERTCVATMAYGMEALAGEPDLLALGDIGAGNRTVAAAMLAALFGGRAETWIGSMPGIDESVRVRQVEAVERALACHEGHLADPLEVLRRLGGRELAAIAGAIVAARTQHVPVILDGLVTTAAAAVLWKMKPEALDHCLFGHVSAEPGHRQALEAMGKVPLLALGMHLGEGTGAALAAGLVKAAARSHAGMATADGGAPAARH